MDIPEISCSVDLFVLVDILSLSQKNFSYVRASLPRLNQFKARINVSCSRTKHSDAGMFEPGTPQSKVMHSYH